VAVASGTTERERTNERTIFSWSVSIGERTHQGTNPMARQRFEIMLRASSTREVINDPPVGCFDRNIDLNLFAVEIDRYLAVERLH
jgi:hypothetical protein